MNNKYEIRGSLAVIFLTHRGGNVETVTVDAQDLKVAQEFKGHFYPFKHPRTGKLYARGYYKDPVTKKVQQPLLHRLIMNPQRGENTAHVDGNTTNCTRANMRNVEIGVDIKDLVEKETRTQEEVKVVTPPATPSHVEVKVQLAADDQEPLKGVSLHKVKQRWEVSPFFEGKRHRLGYFDKDDLAGANAAVTEFRDVGPEEYYRRHPKKGGKT